MTTEAERVTQRPTMRELATLFAASMYPNSPTGALAARLTIAQLCNIDDPRADDVLNAIHAERRRRQSAATRGERRAS